MKSTTKAGKPYGFWNWGTGIAIAIIVAAGAMIFLVYKSINVNFEMVEKDYYAAELKFDGKMKAAENASLLSSDIVISQDEAQMTIQFPHECTGRELKGSLTLYRPSSENNDIDLPLKLSSEGRIVLPKSRLLKGVYRLKASWEMDGKPYYSEQSVYVQP